MLKFLLIILIIFMLLRMMARNMVVSSFEDMQKKMYNEMRRRQQSAQPHNPEGHVSISGKEKNGGSKGSSEQGEYIDYEEVK